MNTIQDLIPLAKFDLERAKAVVEIGYPVVEPILPQLIEWLQDYNWPVAQILAPFLASIGSPIIPHIKYVLESDDDIWKYWILVCIVAESPEVANALLPYLQRYASNPTENEIAEGVHEISQEILMSLSVER